MRSVSIPPTQLVTSTVVKSSSSSSSHLVTTTPQSSSSSSFPPTVKMMHLDEWLCTIRRNFCLCGNCRERIDHRIQDLTSLSMRLGEASFRAGTHGDPRRARAYASQARAARQEAASCTALLSVSVSDNKYALRLLESVTTAIAAVVSLVCHVDCSRLPQKWSKQFTR